MPDPDTTVYVGRGPYTQVYHTERECDYIAGKPDDEVRETTPAAVEPHKSLCEACAGDVDYSDNGRGGSDRIYEIAKRAGEDADHLERVRDAES